MLADLHAERQQIDEAILVLQRIATGLGRRRGRPPKLMQSASGESSNATPRKRFVSPEARARMAAAQRKRWAAKKKADG